MMALLDFLDKPISKRELTLIELKQKRLRILADLESVDFLIKHIGWCKND